ncbi:MAG TPA: serine/threonine-protein kinase [Gaiellaceae bacterium]|nr:serine/threonine-protein kinase [Gaiellaceae bacterium]
MSSTAFALPQRELVLDRYRPLRPLGRGGSGSVWLARDERTGLDVALKVVPREGKRASRAAREAEAATRLRHERCVRAYDFGGDAGHVYIAYEYVPGRTLRDALRHGLVGDRSAVEAAAQVLEALAHAHARGIVHRDVKPANVLLEDGPDVSAKLLDFGLAQFDEADTLTAVGDVPGTLAYMAPERLAGAEASAASDVWAVGVLLWEALAAKHPFWGVPLPQVAATIESGAPPLERERPDLPPRLLRAVAAALDVDPDRRPSAARLAAELRAALDAPRRERRRQAAPRLRLRGRADAAPRAAAPPASRVAHAASAVVAGVVTAAGGALLPFWTPGLLTGLALATAALTWRLPRIGLVLALFAPLLPFGNEAKGAALAYGAVALALLALGWRDPRGGLLFAAGPLLAPLGGLALVPLAVQPARGWLRRGAQAALAVLAAALVAGLRGSPLPLTDERVGNLGVAGTEHAGDVVAALAGVLRERQAIGAMAIVAALAAALLPAARARGRAGIAALCLAQPVAVLAAAPAAPATPVVLGSWLLCGALLWGRGR